MQTYSHFLMTAVAGDVLKKRGVEIRTRAFVLGSFMPDVPLYLLGAGYIAWAFWLAPALGLAPAPDEHIFGDTFDALYFTNPFWMASHNFLHAPLILLTLGAVGVWAMRRGHAWGASLLWFALGCGLHSIVDILTHYDDGPLVFFPIDWSYRFQAPISYWDSRHGAQLFRPFERTLDVLCVLYLIWAWWQGRKLKVENSNPKSLTPHH